MSESKFKPGDRVRVVNYGHPMMIMGLEHEKLAKHIHESPSIFSLLTGIPDIKEEFVYNKPKVLAEENGMITIDGSPELVGQIGVIEGSYLDLYAKYCGKDEESIERNKHQYSILGIPGKSAWYDEGQLEIVN